MIPQPFKSVSNLNPFDLLKKSISLLIGIFIFFNPFPHTTAIKEICYYLSIFIFAVLILTKTKDVKFNTPLLLPFVLLVSWAFLSIFFAIDRENSIHDFYSHLIRYIILYYILINFFNSEKYLNSLSWIIVISSTIFTIGGVIYFYLILGNPLSARFGDSSFVQISANVIGVILVFSAILALNSFTDERRLYLKVFLVFCFTTLSISLLLTQSRSSLIAIFIGGLLFFFNNKKRMFVFASIFLIIIALTPIRKRFSPSYLGSFRNNRQVDIFLITLEAIKDYPITGIGFGLQSYEKLNLEKYRENLQNEYRKRNIITDPHNIILDVTVRLGIPGLVCFSVVTFVFLKMCWNVIRGGKDIYLKNWGRCLAASFVAVFTIGLFEPIFSHMPEVVLCTIFSMITIVYRLNAESIP